VLRAVAVLDDMAAANRCARYIAAQAGGEGPALLRRRVGCRHGAGHRPLRRGHAPARDLALGRVSFGLRSGKALARREIVVHFRSVPTSPSTTTAPGGLLSLEPDRIAPDIDVNGAGDPAMSIRGDEAEESRRIVEPVLRA
jgi:hypothetical protein